MARRFRLQAPRLSENDVEAQCLGVLRLRGYYPVRIQSGLFKTMDGRTVRIGETGIPDYIAMHGQYPAFFLEVKRPGGDLSPEQRSKISILRDAYGIAVAAVDSVEALAVFLETHETKWR